jgi:hypothetical protein
MISYTDEALADVDINRVSIPRYTCKELQPNTACRGPDDTSCDCAKTWTYVAPEDFPPDETPPPGGLIKFAEHFRACESLSERQSLEFELVYIRD